MWTILAIYIFWMHNVLTSIHFFLIENKQNLLFFAPNCQNINIPHGYFLNAWILLHKYAIILLKTGKICKSLWETIRERKIQGERVTWKYRKWKIKGEKYRKFYKYIRNIKVVSPERDKAVVIA